MNVLIVDFMIVRSSINLHIFPIRILVLIRNWYCPICILVLIRN